jgi:hypothetical protein
MKTWAKIGIVFAALLGGSKLFAATKALKVGDQLDIKMINPRIHKIDPNPFGGGIEIRTDVQLQNPTKDSMTLTQPFVQILSKDTVITSSKVNYKEFIIKPMARINLNTIVLKLDWSTIVSTLISNNYNIPKDYTLIQKIGYVISNYKSLLAQMQLGIRYSTYANGLFYESVQTLNSPYEQ